ncbi:MAG: GGDEF domain-containing protein [Sporomusaceae bacterium]|nr:GGDEF domain-containing protein [Sporomusaceae bacterium]
MAFFFEESMKKTCQKAILLICGALAISVVCGLGARLLLEIQNQNREIGVHCTQILLVLCMIFAGLSTYFAFAFHGLKKAMKEQKVLAELAWHERDFDKLSGLKNRNAFIRAVEMIEENGLAVSLFLCDVDGLKVVNDTLGHTEGDALIQRAAQVLQSFCEDGTDVFRIGGDEYVILFYEKKTEDDLEALKRAIKLQIAAQNETASFPLSLSIGFATTSLMVSDFQAVLKEADHRMYEEKRIYRDRVYQCFQEIFRQ